MKKSIIPALLMLLSYTVQAQNPTYDLSKDKVLYTVGYAHLDTEWNWDYPVNHQQLHQKHHAGELPFVREVPRIRVQLHWIQALRNDEGILPGTLSQSCSVRQGRSLAGFGFVRGRRGSEHFLLRIHDSASIVRQPVLQKGIRRDQLRLHVARLLRLFWPMRQHLDHCGLLGFFHTETVLELGRRHTFQCRCLERPRRQRHRGGA